MQLQGAPAFKYLLLLFLVYEKDNFQYYMNGVHVIHFVRGKIDSIYIT